MLLADERNSTAWARLPLLHERASSAWACSYPIFMSSSIFSSFVSLLSDSLNSVLFSSQTYSFFKNGTETSPPLKVSLFSLRSIQHWCLFRLSRPKRKSTDWFSMTSKELTNTSPPILSYALWTQPNILLVPPTPRASFANLVSRRFKMLHRSAIC